MNLNSPEAAVKKRYASAAQKPAAALCCPVHYDTRFLQANPELWSGCISGALTETGFLHAFGEAGFDGVQILRREEIPWRVVEGLEFRSVTVQALKGKPDSAGGQDAVATRAASPCCQPGSCC